MPPNQNSNDPSLPNFSAHSARAKSHLCQNIDRRAACGVCGLITCCCASPLALFPVCVKGVIGYALMAVGFFGQSVGATLCCYGCGPCCDDTARVHPQATENEEDDLSATESEEANFHAVMPNPNIVMPIDQPLPRHPGRGFPRAAWMATDIDLPIEEGLNRSAVGGSFVVPGTEDHKPNPLSGSELNTF